MNDPRVVALDGGVAAGELPTSAPPLTPHAVVAGGIIAAIGVSVLMMALAGVWLLVSASRLAPADAAANRVARRSSPEQPSG